MRATTLALLLASSCHAQIEELFEAPPAAMHLSPERAEEVMNASDGDVLPSTGRKLEITGRPKDRFADVEAWGSAPLPTRIRDYHNHHFNSDKWDLVTARDDDVVVATMGKSGTTWMQAIIINLIYGGSPPEIEGAGMMDLAPWVDMRLPPPAAVAPTIEANTDRRCLKTHLPLDGVNYSEKTKYIMVTRDVRDVAYSWHNHLMTCLKSGLWQAMDMLPGRAGSGMGEAAEKDPSPHELFLDMIDDESDGAETGLWSYFHHLATWWQYKHLPNIKLVHYANMKKDPKGMIKEIADFIGIEATPELVDIVAHKTSFEQMKKDSSKIMGPMFDKMMATKEGEEGGKNFIYKGTNGRWKDDVTAEETAKYIKYATERLGEGGMKWLTEGEMLPAVLGTKDEL